jgi:type I restriction enzyme S subunit
VSWPTACLGDLATAHYGKALKEGERDPTGSYTVFGSSGPVGTHSEKLCEAPTIVIGRKGSVGEVTYAPVGGWPIDTTYYLQLHQPDRLDLRYLYWALSHARLGQRAITTSIPGLNRDELYRARLIFPPLAEQRRIAALLDKADAVRRKRRESLRLLDEFLRSAFLEMFGDPVRNEKGWEVAELQDIAGIVSGVTKGRKLHGNAAQDVPYLRVANVQDGFLDLGEVKTIPATRDEIEQYRLEPGDILLTEGGDPDKLGRGAIWGGEIHDCIHQNHIFRVRLHDAGFLPDYVSALLGTAYGKRYFLRAAKQTTGIASINRTQLGGFPVIKAPREAQERYSAAVVGVRVLRDRLADSTLVVDRLFDSLAQRAFGEHASAAGAP